MLKMKKIRNERGQTMVEFAMVAPLLLILLLGILQFGATFNRYLTLTDAVRAGARKGAVSRGVVDPKGACENEVLAAAGASPKQPGGLDPNDLSVSCSSTWSAGADVTVTATYPYSIKLLNLPIWSGNLSSTMKERVE
jgi:Flp pilus assembly protein TadG